MLEMQVWSLGWDDPLEEDMVTHSSILSWETHGQRILVGYYPWGRKDSGTTEAIEHSTIIKTNETPDMVMKSFLGWKEL